MKRRQFHGYLGGIWLGMLYPDVIWNTEEPTPEELCGIATAEDLCRDDVVPLRREPYEAFMDMKNDAEKVGIKMWCSSGYRSFHAQKGIWNNKFLTLKEENSTWDEQKIIKYILQYSAFPGTSRHHWGTDLDITDAYAYENPDPLCEENYLLGGEYQYLNVWLEQNSKKYQFFQPYTNDPSRSGYKYEPWHYSYAPLAKKYLKLLLQIDFKKIEPIRGVYGSEVMVNKLIESYKKEYLLGIADFLK